MISGISAALSGFNAAAQQLSVNANNIANQFSTQTTTNTNGQTTTQPYQPQQVVQSALATGGVTTKTVPLNSPTVSTPPSNSPTLPQPSSLPQSNVDPAQQLISSSIASYDAQANLKSIKVQAETFQQVLNIIS